MNQTTEVTTESVKAVWFSILTDDEVRKYSFLRITEPKLLDSVGRPLPGGLYDPTLGPLDETSLCKTCGQRQFLCPGHFGHIDLVCPIYNPLLFNFLYNLLQRTCFFCHHFRAGGREVEKCVAQLKLIIKGDIVAAKSLDSDLPTESSNPEDSDGSHKSSCTTVHPCTQYDNVNHLRPQEWTSLQSAEAKSVLRDFLKIKTTKCKNCKAKNPSISKPTFGWIHMSGMPRAHIRANIIRGCNLGESFSAGAGDETEADVEDASDVDTPETHASDRVSPAPRRHKKGLDRMSYDYKKQKDLFSGPLLPTEAKNIVKNLWENEFELCSFISDMQQQGFAKKAGHHIFFLETILVPPIKFRLPTKGGDSVMEHPQTVLLSKVLQCNIYLGNAYVNQSEHAKTIARWMELQQSVNVFFDGKTAAGQRDQASGICQLLEKKEGLFRQKLMGKRVNFACRSVISPDPYLAVNEIGIPPYFALRLTYPERVTSWNVTKLRDSIVNGPEVHPGATHYLDKLSTMKLPPSKKMRISISRKLPSSRGAIMQAGKDPDYEFEGKIVYRHLQDGDIVLVNRQPTLHKPSIMAHVVRVLKGEKTLRMHYANCSTYNADFDGDEMNVHFPQDEISRAEAYNIVNANNQYVRPSNGDPLRALIQDHIVSAAVLTKKDTFLSRDEFYQLLYSSGVSSSGLGSFSSKPGQKVLMSSSEQEVLSLPPTIWKPEPLWTGKQVITAVLNHITRGRPTFTVEKGGKIPQDFFKTRFNADKRSDKKSDKGKLRKKGKMDKDKPNKEKEADENKSKQKELTEEKLLIYKNDLVRGVIDKAQFADYGLIHTVQELYGSNTAGTLLSALSRLFTVFLQMHGFTCGVDDLLIVKEKDRERKNHLESSERIGKKIHLEALDLGDDAEIDPVKLQSEIEKTIRGGGDVALAYFDMKMTSELNKHTSSPVINELLSEGLLKPTGKNCISLMTTSGAKGSKVNFQQISSHLGQQELEGKRVPRMVSGKTLPSFYPWDWAPRAGGFIIDRFLTGLRPQEYYFHCMAGREGLVDTAVKTSRSGYLQRCLIKNLECLKICYDYSVRDADGSIIQFRYGEDGVDVHQTSFISKFEALAANKDMIYKKCDDEFDASNGYIMELPDALKDKAEKFTDKLLSNDLFCHKLVKKDFFKLLKHKYVLSLAQPGEPVGLLAAQSVGEPSTQMTLNTFHLAGRGEMNVTLGIPRLQEILTIASKDIKTPVMTCPFQVGKTEEDAKRIADKLKKITVADIVERIDVDIKAFTCHDGQMCTVYVLKMKLYKPKSYPRYTNITVEDWEEILEVVFVRELEDAIQNHLLLLSKISGIKNSVSGSSSKAANEMDEEVSGIGSQHRGDNDDVDDEYGEDAEDLGMDAQKHKQRATDEKDYEDDSEEEQSEGVSLAGFGSEIDQAENESEHDQALNEVDNDQSEKEVENEIEISKHEASKNLKASMRNLSKKKTKSETKRKRVRAKLVKKETDRAIYVAAKGMHFEAHFKFINEPHILLAQIARHTANKVYIQSSGKIYQCQVTNCKESQVIYYGKDPKKREDIKPEEKEKVQALHTTGVDFHALWRLQDFLDVRYVYSNNIQGMLETYGVEAARETIIREIKHVFGSYGISVNSRHLSVIADYMTHSGGYRPMSRLGGIAESVSPFSKMTFETASKFIVEAASYGEVDKLETPSARICLGLPVKMGTGSFDLMHKVEV